MTTFVCNPSESVYGYIRVPGDKSISHRSIILSSIAHGTSEISGFLEGEDSLHTLQAFQDMGVNIEQTPSEIIVHGVGMQGLSKPTRALDMGNSGTAMRLLVGLLSGQVFDTQLIGDASLSTRPMKRVIDPIQLMGGEINSEADGTAPLWIHGGVPLKAIHYELPVASAQVKSCVLLAGLYADGITEVIEPAPTRDHTERMLRGFGCEVISTQNKISMRGGQSLEATNIEIPADISSAAFFMVAASILPQSEMTLNHVGVNPTRIGIIDILELMGADITLINEREVGGEPVADIVVKSAPLKGIEIPKHLVPLAIDEFPVIFVAASFAQGTTILTGAEELRVKESDRIQVMADGLNNLGVHAQATADGIVIQGGPVSGGEVDSHGDHRIAMAFAVASLGAKTAITINDCDNVNTSFPGFADLANHAGFQIEVT
ncbi:MAG: 3-phosphoshikimate 1-carboxyvinyltransferase [Gammaproteobacteria bacterium]|nr:3-phosphoshikimate 1-carboxyvinyltransferase [Gammaproteobacteria bacterium]